MGIDRRCLTLTRVLLAGLLLAVPGTLQASTLLVTDFGDSGAAGQLRSLINAAAAGDTILIPPGVIVLTGAAGENANVEGDLDILKDLTIVGAGAGLTVIDANHVDRSIDILSGITVTISGLTMRNGSVDPDAETDPSGGGLLNRGVSTTLANVIVESNFAGGGGGIANFAGTVTLWGSTVRDNSSTGLTANGGGISNFAKMDILHSTISGNAVFGTSSSTVGGGIVNVGTLTMHDSTVVNNVATGNLGGGIYSTPGAGPMALVNVTIAGNKVGTSSGFGGGLATVSVAGVTLVNTLIADNTAFGTGSGPDCYGTITSLGHNLVENSSGCGLVAVASDILDRRAGLRSFGANGGPTFTYSLNRSSRAVDAGDAGSCGSSDQRGVVRPLDGNGDGIAVCDIGAFELEP